MNFSPEMLFNFLQSGGSPQKMANDMLQQYFKGSPLGDHLLELAQKNDSAAIEQIARNLCKQRGIDFDKAFNSFKQQLGIK